MTLAVVVAAAACSDVDDDERDMAGEFPEVDNAR